MESVEFYMNDGKDTGSVLIVGLFVLLVCASIAIFVFLSWGTTGSNESPSAGFDWSPHSPSQGENIIFDASQSSDPDGNIISYKWHFGDGTTRSGKIVTHDYEVARPYTVTLVVTDDDGGIDNENHRIAFAAPA